MTTKPRQPRSKNYFIERIYKPSEEAIDRAIRLVLEAPRPEPAPETPEQSA